MTFRSPETLRPAGFHSCRPARAGCRLSGGAQRGWNDVWHVETAQTLVPVDTLSGPPRDAPRIFNEYAPRPIFRSAGVGRNIEGRERRVVLEPSNRQLSPGLLLPNEDQGARNLPVTSLTYNQPAIRFEMSSINGVFGTSMTGVIKMTGTWIQAGKKFPLTFQRVKAFAQSLRIPKRITAREPAIRCRATGKALWMPTRSYCTSCSMSLMPDGSNHHAQSPMKERPGSRARRRSNLPIPTSAWSGMGSMAFSLES